MIDEQGRWRSQIKEIQGHLPEAQMYEDDADTLAPPWTDPAVDSEFTESVKWLREHDVITPPFESLFR